MEWSYRVGESGICCPAFEKGRGFWRIAFLTGWVNRWKEVENSFLFHMTATATACCLSQIEGLIDFSELDRIQKDTKTRLIGLL